MSSVGAAFASDQGIALALAIGLAIVLAAIKLPDQAKTKRLYFGWAVFGYFFICAVAYTATTLAVVAVLKPGTLPGPLWFWLAFFGVFAFETLLKRLNVTIGDNGVLSIQDWMTTALAGASAEMLRAEAVEIEKSAMIAAQRLAVNPMLDALIIQYLGAETVAKLEALADQAKADRHFVKALAFATAKPDAAQAASEVGAVPLTAASPTTPNSPK